MSLRERAFNWGKNPTFGGRSKLRDLLSEVRLKVFHPGEKQRTRRIARRYEPELQTQRPPKIYRLGMPEEEISGLDVADVISASKAKVVSVGDRLEVIIESIDFDRNRPVHDVEEVTFLGLTDDQPLFQDPQSTLWDEITYPDNIVHWKKLRAGTTEEIEKINNKQAAA